MEKSNEVEATNPEKVNALCPQCKSWFMLRWNDYNYRGRKQTLFPRSCPSGGMYDIRIECPHCDYSEQL